MVALTRIDGVRHPRPPTRAKPRPGVIQKPCVRCMLIRGPPLPHAKVIGNTVENRLGTAGPGRCCLRLLGPRPAKTGTKCPFGPLCKIATVHRCSGWIIGKNVTGYALSVTMAWTYKGAAPAPDSCGRYVV